MALAVTLYFVAAWMVRPGFYDGIQPSQPYNFVCPPPMPGADSGVKPSSGHLDIKVINGISDANSAFTDDGQAIIGFLPGAFDATDKAGVSVDITPVSPCPKPNGLQFVTNTYLISADAPLQKSASLVLTYSDVQLDPSYVYYAPSPDGPWTNLGSAPQVQFWTIEPASPPTRLGYFAAGFPSNAISRNSVSSQLLPAAVAILIVGVLVAGVPLAVMRRRQLEGDADDETSVE